MRSVSHCRISCRPINQSHLQTRTKFQRSIAIASLQQNRPCPAFCLARESNQQRPPTRPLPASNNLFCNYCKQAGNTLFHCPTKPARPPRFGPRPFGQQQQQQFLHGSTANRFAGLQRSNGAARRAYSQGAQQRYAILHVLQEAWPFRSRSMESLPTFPMSCRKSTRRSTVTRILTVKVLPIAAGVREVARKREK